MYYLLIQVAVVRIFQSSSFSHHLGHHLQNFRNFSIMLIVQHLLANRWNLLLEPPQNYLNHPNVNLPPSSRKHLVEEQIDPYPAGMPIYPSPVEYLSHPYLAWSPIHPFAIGTQSHHQSLTHLQDLFEHFKYRTRHQLHRSPHASLLHLDHQSSQMDLAASGRQQGPHPHRLRFISNSCI